MARNTKRRGAGEGSIFQRKDGRWAATITAGYSATGKRIRKTVYGKTKAAVQQKLSDLQTRKATGTLIDAGKMTVSEWLEHWCENIAKPGLRPNTYVSYRGIVTKYLKAKLGRLQLTKLSPVHLQTFYGEMKAGGSSDRHLLKVHAILRRSLNVAMRQGMLSRNPCLLIDPPKYDRPEMQTLTAEQVGALVKASEGDRYGAVIVLAVTTGLRQGELFGLQWQDIDLKAGTLSVRRSLSEVGGHHQFGPPKSKSGIRSLRLPAVAIESLQAHRAIMLREGLAASDLVFCDTGGKPVRKSNFTRRYFKPLLRAAGVPDIRFHDLRHTSATMMLADNVHPKVVQQRLGHSQITLTLDTYSHVLPGMDEAAAGTFDRLLPKATDAG